VPAPGSSEYENHYKNIFDEIVRTLRKTDNFNTLLTFENLLQNDFINDRYAYVQIDNDYRFLNRHDKLHALKVVMYSLRFFNELKHYDRLISLETPRDEKDIRFATTALYKLPEDYSCLAVVTAAYVHDMYRYMIDHGLAAALMIQSVFEGLRLCDRPERDRVNRIMPIIEQCIMRHGGDLEAQNAEQAVVMLADSADNDKERTRGTFRVEEVIRRDRRPIEYFSCRDVERVEVGPSAYGKRLDVTFYLLGNAGWHQVHNFYRTLMNSNLGDLIALYVRSPGLSDIVQIWPPEEK